MGKLRALLASLVEQEPLSARRRDHPLRGIWKGYREAHLEPGLALDLPCRRSRVAPGPYRYPFRLVQGIGAGVPSLQRLLPDQGQDLAIFGPLATAVTEYADFGSHPGQADIFPVANRTPPGKNGGRSSRPSGSATPS